MDRKCSFQVNNWGYEEARVYESLRILTEVRQFTKWNSNKSSEDTCNDCLPAAADTTTKKKKKKKSTTKVERKARGQTIHLAGEDRSMAKPAVNQSDGNLLTKASNVVADKKVLTAVSYENERLREELHVARNTIERLLKSEEKLRSKLSTHAKKEIDKKGKFEDINNKNRPTELVRAYEHLYAQGRLDAMDALDVNCGLLECSEHLKSRLVFSVIVLAFRVAVSYSNDLHGIVSTALQLNDDDDDDDDDGRELDAGDCANGESATAIASAEVRSSVRAYLKSSVSVFDISAVQQSVESQLWAAMCEYPQLKSCQPLQDYIKRCCRVAWGLVNQTPAFTIDNEQSRFNKAYHERFHTSNANGIFVIEYVWPSLIDTNHGRCASKGHVVTVEDDCSTDALPR